MLERDEPVGHRAQVLRLAVNRLCKIRANQLEAQNVSGHFRPGCSQSALNGAPVRGGEGFLTGECKREEHADQSNGFGHLAAAKAHKSECGHWGNASTEEWCPLRTEAILPLQPAHSHVKIHTVNGPIGGLTTRAGAPVATRLSHAPASHYGVVNFRSVTVPSVLCANRIP